jgi:hypothetical protein
MIPEQDIKPDFKKLAAEAFGLKNIEVKSVPKVRAILYQGDHEIAKGSTEVGDDRVVFFPESPRVLESLPPTPISLIVLDNSREIHLSMSRSDFELSSRLMWFFQLVA